MFTVVVVLGSFALVICGVVVGVVFATPIKNLVADAVTDAQIAAAKFAREAEAEAQQAIAAANRVAAAAVHDAELARAEAATLRQKVVAFVEHSPLPAAPQQSAQLAIPQLDTQGAVTVADYNAGNPFMGDPPAPQPPPVFPASLADAFTPPAV